MLLAQVPQTATRQRRRSSAPAVNYQGEPQFEPIEKTSVARAVNTDKDILKVGDMYYMCFEGVWLCLERRHRTMDRRRTRSKEIDEIPISSPAHNVTYVTVEEHGRRRGDVRGGGGLRGNDGGVGLRGLGLGLVLPALLTIRRATIPLYYGYYPSYGYGASYNPWTGAYSRGGGGVRSVRRRRLRSEIQPGDRHMGARGGRVRSGGRAGSGSSV